MKLNLSKTIPVQPKAPSGLGVVSALVWAKHLAVVIRVKKHVRVYQSMDLRAVKCQSTVVFRSGA